MEGGRGIQQQFHHTAAFLFRHSRRHDPGIDLDRDEDQDHPGKGEHIAGSNFARRASRLARLGLHDDQVRCSAQALGLLRGEAQAMSGIQKGELLGQTLDRGQVGIVGRTVGGVIGKAHILVRRTIKHQQDIQLATLHLLLQVWEARELAEKLSAKAGGRLSAFLLSHSVPSRSSRQAAVSVQPATEPASFTTTIWVCEVAKLDPP